MQSSWAHFTTSLKSFVGRVREREEWPCCSGRPITKAKGSHNRTLVTTPHTLSFRSHTVRPTNMSKDQLKPITSISGTRPRSFTASSSSLPPTNEYALAVCGALTSLSIGRLLEHTALFLTQPLAGVSLPLHEHPAHISPAPSPNVRSSERSDLSPPCLHLQSHPQPFPALSWLLMLLICYWLRKAHAPEGKTFVLPFSSCPGTMSRRKEVPAREERGRRVGGIPCNKSLTAQGF